MNLLEVKKLVNGDVISTVGVLIKNNLIAKAGGGNYLQIGLKDAKGLLEFPVFDRAETIHEKLVEGNIYMIRGTVNLWNGNVQVKSPVFTPMDTDTAIKNLGVEYFLPSYSSESINESIEYIEKTISSMREPYKSFVAKATGFADRDSDMYKSFTICPSAEKHHGAKLGGLVVHTAGVLKMVNSMLNEYITNTIPDYRTETPVLDVCRVKTKTILHDIMKVNEYEYKTVIRRIPNVVGHLIDGTGYIDNLNNEMGGILPREEMENIKFSILNHHGQYGPYKPESLEDQLVHLADMIDSRMVGEIENK